MKYNQLIRFSLTVSFLFCVQIGLYAQNTGNLKRAEILVDTLDNFFIQNVDSLALDKVEFFTMEKDGTPIIKVIENGLEHKNGTIGGFPYKETYKLNDNIKLLGYRFKIKNIDLINSKVTIGEEYMLIDMIYQPKEFDISRYYGKKEYLFIYEWTPINDDSVEMLSLLNAWHKKYGKCISFLGVCYGTEKDKKSAKKLWEKNNTGFKMIYIEKELQTCDFPGFVIIHRPWLSLNIAGKEYTPIVIENLNEIKEECYGKE